MLINIIKHIPLLLYLQFRLTLFGTFAGAVWWPINAIFAPLFTFLALSLFALISIGIIFPPVCNNVAFMEGTGFCDLVHDVQRFATPVRIPYPAFFESHSQGFGDMAASSSIVLSASSDFTSAYIDVDNLKLLVEHSNISRKGEMLETLSGLGLEARTVGLGLQRYSTMIGAAMERVKLANRGVETVLSSKGAIHATHDWACGALHLTHIPAICPSFFAANLDRVYNSTLVGVNDELVNLVLYASNLMNQLDALDERLKTVLYLVSAEEAEVEPKKDEVSRRLLSYIGFYRDLLAQIEKSLRTLRNVGSYSKAARKCVDATYTLVYDLQGDVEELRVAGVKGLKREWISLEDSIVLMKAGIERLEGGQTHAKRNMALLAAKLDVVHKEVIIQ